MRIALIILSLMALLFIGGISWSLVNQEWGWKINLPRSTVGTNTDVDTITLETWKNQIKTEEKISRLTEMMEELARRNNVPLSTENSSPSVTPTNTATGDTQTGSDLVMFAVKPSPKLLGLLIPTLSPMLEENHGIFGLNVFDASLRYSTYKDTRINVTLIPIETNYDSFLKYMKNLTASPYVIKETQTFSFRSFFVNPQKTDTNVRLVVEMEWQTVAFEIPKTRYDILKNLLLGKPATLPPVSSTGLTRSGSAVPGAVIVPVKNPVPPTPQNSTHTKSGITIKILTGSIYSKSGTVR